MDWKAQRDCPTIGPSENCLSADVELTPLHEVSEGITHYYAPLAITRGGVV